MEHPDKFKERLRMALMQAELGIQGESAGPWWTLFEAICELQAQFWEHDFWHPVKR